MIGTVEKKLLEDRRIAGNEAGAHARNIRTFRQAGKHHQSVERAAKCPGCLKASERRIRLVKENLRVTLVGGDDKAIFVRQGEEELPVFKIECFPGRVAGRANKKELNPLPFFVAQGVVIESKVVFRQGIQKAQIGAGEVSRTLVNLIEGIGAHNQRDVTSVAAPRRINNRLCKGEQRLARAVDRDDMRLRIDVGKAIAALHPFGDGMTQGGYAQRGRIIRQTAESGSQRVLDESRCRVLRLANRELDLPQFGVRRHAGKELAQSFKRVGMQSGEIWIHVICNTPYGIGNYKGHH